MPKLQTVAFLLLSATQLSAESVLWTANGTLGSGSGVLSRTDLPPGSPLELRLTYNDQAIPQFRSGFIDQSIIDYRTEIELRIVITSGIYTWEGFVDSAEFTGPTTFLTTVSPPSERPFLDRLEVNLDSTDNGTFPSFPFRLGNSDAAFQLDLLGQSQSFLGSGISPNDYDLTQIATFTGAIVTGAGNTLPFTIDPSSMVVIFEADEVIAPIAPILTLTTTADSATLSWLSDFRFRYQIESTTDLSSNSWASVEPPLSLIHI